MERSVTYPDHQIQCQPEAVVAGLVRIAVDRLHLSRELVQNRVPGTDDVRLTFIRRDRRVRGRAAGQTALEGIRARAETGLGGAGALVRPATVAAGAAGCFGAALDVVRVVGAEAGVGFAAAARAGGGADAGAGGAVDAAAAVDGGVGGRSEEEEGGC